MVNAEVSKSGNESPLSVIRKFSRRVQGTGLIQLSRKRRYFTRNTSKAVAKKRALKRIKRRDEFKRLVKEGKAVEAPQRRGYHSNRPSTPQSRPPRESTPAPVTPARFGEDIPIAR